MSTVILGREVIPFNVKVFLANSRTVCSWGRGRKDVFWYGLPTVIFIEGCVIVVREAGASFGSKMVTSVAPISEDVLK